MSLSSSRTAAKSFVVGRSGFAAITAVEGHKLTRAGETRLQNNRTLSPEQRRAGTIRALVETRKRG